MTNHSSPVKETDLLARLRDFVAAESKRWVNCGTGELERIEVSPAGKLAQEAIEALARPAQCAPGISREALIHTICPHIKVWCDDDDVPNKTCEQCPPTVQTSQGEGVQMCRLNAEAAADAVLALSSTDGGAA